MCKIKHLAFLTMPYVVDLQRIFDRKVYMVIGCTPSAAAVQSHAAQPLPVFVKGLPCKLNLVGCTFQTIY